MGGIGAAITGVSDVASLAGGGKGGGSGGSNPNPDWMGGVTPEQMSLAQYGYGGDLLQGQSRLGSEGAGMSTMATQVAGGAEMGKALELAKMSDANQQAIGQAAQTQQANQQALQTQQGQLAGSLASLANQGLGTQPQTTSGTQTTGG